MMTGRALNYIEDIAPGDQVWAADPATGRRSLRPVVRLFRNHTNELLELHLANGEHLRTTPQHPFYTRARAFVPAEQLQPGDRLTDRYGCEVQVVSSRRLAVSDEPIFNFEVDTDHTYFVGHSAILVHNESDRNAFDLPMPADKINQKFSAEQVAAINSKDKIEDPTSPGRTFVRKPNTDGGVYFAREYGKTPDGGRSR